MAFLSMEGFVGNGALKGVLPKLLEEGWEDVQTMKLMKTEDMDAINMTQQQKAALEMRSYLHDRALLQYGNKLEASGKNLSELLGLSIDELSAEFGMKRGHIARFMEKRISSTASACEPDPLQQDALTSTTQTNKPSRNNNSIHKVIMNPTLYTALMEGEVDVLMRHIDQFDVEITLNNNTVLHVAAQFGRLKCVEKILKQRHAFLHRVNNRGETPLHIAAREQYLDVVKALIDCAKRLNQDVESGGGAAKVMLRATNEDKDTALHMAVRNQHLDMVKLLTQEDPDFPHLANNAQETPLYLAAELGDASIVSEILVTCISPAYSGPGGRTALHAAVINHWNFLKNARERNLQRKERDQCIRKLLEWKPDFIKEVDEYGWTPLHYAAHSDNVEGVEQLLKIDKSIAYITSADKDDGWTALHIAAARGNVEVMKEILLHCPDCWETVDGKGQNFFHVAMDMKQERAIKFIKEKPWFSHIKKQKDIEGNTPMHLQAAVSCMSIKRIQEWGPREYNWAFNNKNMTPEDVELSAYLIPSSVGGRCIVSEDQKYIANLKRVREEKKKKKAQTEERRKTQKEELHQRVETQLIVATLIATITFAAAFTVPGGYDSNEGPKQGMPILLREAAFKVFVITNTIAVICSTSSVLLFLSASLYHVDDDDDDYDEDDNNKYKQARRYHMALRLILIAVAAMTVGFITGSYATLAHSLSIAIFVCVIGCVSFLIYFIELQKLRFFEVLVFRIVWRFKSIMRLSMESKAWSRSSS